MGDQESALHCACFAGRPTSRLVMAELAMGCGCTVADVRELRLFLRPAIIVLTENLA